MFNPSDSIAATTGKVIVLAAVFCIGIALVAEHGWLVKAVGVAFIAGCGFVVGREAA